MWWLERMLGALECNDSSVCIHLILFYNINNNNNYKNNNNNKKKNDDDDDNI